MIIGKGMLAKRFQSFENNENVLIFASGVSNSNETNKDQFNREKELLLSSIEDNNNKKFIYFSSCSLSDDELKNTPYHLHKKEMENIVSDNCNSFLIFRLPNVIGFDGNSNNIVNYLVNMIKENKKFDIWKNATRNIVDIDDIFKIVSYVIDNNSFINLAMNIVYKQNTKVYDIVKTIEKLVDKKVDYNLVDKGSDIKIADENIASVMLKLNIQQPKLEELIKKYRKI